MTGDRPLPRLAGPDDAPELARLLHDFNTEFDTPSPGPDVLEPRIRSLLAGASTLALLAGPPGSAAAFALVTVRPNVWYDGPVALLDELYVRPDLRGTGIGSDVMALLASECEARQVALVEINVDESDDGAQRFYERHGFSGVDPDSGERAFYFSKEL